MAGLGHKTFTRERLTSGDVQGYLMDQAVMAYPSAAARGASLTSPSEGMVSYLTDVDRLEIFDGTSWGSRFAFGTVAAVRATTTASSSSGTEQRLAGGHNLAATLFPGRQYEAVLSCAVQAAAAAGRVNVLLRVSAGATTPATTDPAASAWYGYLGAAGSAGQGRALTAGEPFQVSAQGLYNSSVFVNSTGSAAGAVSILSTSASGAIFQAIRDSGPADASTRTLL